MTHAAPNNEDSSLNDLERLGQSMGAGAAGEAGGSEALPALPQRKAPAFLKFMPEVVREMWDRGATFKLDSNSGELLIDGFYKNGALRLDVRDEGVVAIDRRGRESQIRSFDDLVNLNYRFWRQANSQKGVYIQPHRPWLDAMLDKKKLKRQVIFVAADENDGADIEE